VDNATAPAATDPTGHSDQLERVNGATKAWASDPPALLAHIKAREAEDAELLMAIRARRAQLRDEDAELAEAEAKLTRKAVPPKPPIAHRDHEAVVEPGTSVRKRILMFLAEHGRSSTDAVIAAMVGASPVTVRQSLYDMASKPKTVRRAGPAMWEITPRGRATLQGAAPWELKYVRGLEGVIIRRPADKKKPRSRRVAVR
jgi:hypothetical protein